MRFLTVCFACLLLSGCTLWRSTADERTDTAGERVMLRTEDRQELVIGEDGPQLVTLRTTTTERETSKEIAQLVAERETTAPLPVVPSTPGGMLALVAAWAAREAIPLVGKIMRRNGGNPLPAPDPEPQPGAIAPEQRRRRGEYAPHDQGEW